MNYGSEELQYHLGVKKSDEELKSYTKLMAKKERLAYDDESIYLVDKLHLTFTNKHLNETFENFILVEADSNYHYQLDPEILLRKQTCNNNYLYNYLVEVSGNTFGYIRLRNTAIRKLVKIEIDNKILFELPKVILIDVLMRITIILDLAFCNISKYELARDSSSDYYNQFAQIFYQSQLCADQIFKIYNAKPKYAAYKGKLNMIHNVNNSNNKYGTFNIGSIDSDTQMAIYVKSNELKSWGEEKSYISEIHRKHFGKDTIISRVEVKANANSINKFGLDLIDILNPEMHPTIFFNLAGEKLRFKDLESITWDKNRNKKYSSFDLIPLVYKIKKPLIKTIPIEQENAFTHNNNANKIRLLVTMFLDNESGFMTVIDFLKKNIWKSKIDSVKVEFEIDRAIRNYRNPKNKKVLKKIKFLKRLVKSDGNFYQLATTLINYWL
jgi:hypothetical protein